MKSSNAPGFSCSSPETQHLRFMTEFLSILHVSTTMKPRLWAYCIPVYLYKGTRLYKNRKNGMQAPRFELERVTSKKKFPTGWGRLEMNTFNWDRCFCCFFRVVRLWWWTKEGWCICRLLGLKRSWLKNVIFSMN